MANIVIQTENEYQNKNLATKVVQKISEECLNRGLIPTYWVNKNNIPSIMVAEKAGFKLLSKEIVLSIELNTNNGYLKLN